MEERKIENIGYFNVGAILNSIALMLFILPQEYEKALLTFGSKWGYWWYHLVDSVPIILALLGSAALMKAFNYKGSIWPSSKPRD
jgi:hypothetical protein